jgi:hypothetical protein
MTVVILVMLMYEEGVFTYDLSSLIHEYFFYRYFLMGVAALFIASYSIFSILVLIFNLPTGFVFEKTRKDLVSIQKIQQSATQETELLPTLHERSADIRHCQCCRDCNRGQFLQSNPNYQHHQT